MLLYLGLQDDRVVLSAGHRLGIGSPPQSQTYPRTDVVARASVMASED